MNPGMHALEEMHHRGWSVHDLATESGLDDETLKDVLVGEHPVTNVIASRLAEAFGTSAALWTNLQQSWDRARSTSEDPS